MTCTLGPCFHAFVDVIGVSLWALSMYSIGGDPSSQGFHITAVCVWCVYHITHLRHLGLASASEPLLFLYLEVVLVFTDSRVAALICIQQWTRFFFFHNLSSICVILCAMRWTLKGVLLCIYLIAKDDKLWGISKLFLFLQLRTLYRNLAHILNWNFFF